MGKAISSYSLMQIPSPIFFVLNHAHMFSHLCTFVSLVVKSLLDDGKEYECEVMNQK